MNIAVTANDNYAYPLYIMLQTLFAGNSTVLIHVWLVHSRMSRENVELLEKICEKKGQQFTEIKVSEDSFQKAPEFSYFTKEMYYRIMLAEWLPVTAERVLYLDPDLIVLDFLKGLYEIPEGDWCIAAREAVPEEEKVSDSCELMPLSAGCACWSQKALEMLSRTRETEGVQKKRGRIRQPECCEGTDWCAERTDAGNKY